MVKDEEKKGKISGASPQNITTSGKT